MLHELVARHAQSLLAELRHADPDGGGLPRYVERELAAYLRCGILAHGFTRVRCQTCHDEYDEPAVLVPGKLDDQLRWDLGLPHILA